MNYKLYLAFVLIFSLISCRKDDDRPNGGIPNEEELITTVKLRFENTQNVNDTVLAIFQDIDGQGGLAPSQFDTIQISAGKEYLLSINVLDESNSNNIIDITNEIKEEAADHQFFFGGSSIDLNHLTIKYGDIDENSFPVGLLDTVQANTVGTDLKLKVILKHEPNKNASGVSDGNINNAGGDTDIELDFSVNIE